MTPSTDPRAIRSRKAFQNSLIDLLKIKSYQTITIADIARHAGFARHTFYNHYETKDDLLSNIIDAIFDNFFSRLEKYNFTLNQPEGELMMVSSFFKVWRESEEIVGILNNLDIDDVLIKRLNAYFTNYYYERVLKEMPGVDFELAKYMISFNTYTLLGILKPWLNDGMKHPPEVMAKFLIQLSGSTQRRQAVERFKDIIEG
ncbi:MAG: TetR/AcrR family transcriptional regulator [Ardenticatenaceae bacterium]|nr:TetR/AcrR family transcriptional regulator [Ardenticatenaceae bacterium]